MSADALLARLHQGGLSISVDGDRLLVRPRATLTDEWRQQIRASKDELLELLRDEAESSVSCVFCPNWLAPGDPLCCPAHRDLLGHPATDGWRCICTSTYRRHRREHGDWVCAGCGMTTGAPP